MPNKPYARPGSREFAWWWAQKRRRERLAAQQQEN